MGRGRRPFIVIKPHFRKRWRDDIGPDPDGVIIKRLQSALKNKTLRGTLDGFAVNIEGRKAICTIGPTGKWIFITLLRHGMELKVADEVAVGCEKAKEGAGC